MMGVARRWWIGLAIGVLASAILALSACGGEGTGARAAVHADQPNTRTPPKNALRLIVGAPTKVHPIRSGFLGLSIEYPSIEPYAGTDPDNINPLFIQLIKNLTPNQRPVIRVGGDSTDWMWWPVPHMRKPNGVRYTLTPQWMAVTKALAQELNAKLILGLDLEANNLAMEKAEANAFESGLGNQSIEAFEPGNEPELYGSWAWYVSPDGTHVHGRSPNWSIEDYEHQVATLRQTLQGAPLAGPSTGGPIWTARLPQFVSASPYLKLVTIHSYPLQLCYTPASSPKYPTVGNLLSEQSSLGLAAGVAPYVRLAHSHGKPIRIGEMNTNSCGSAPRVTKSFASALWAVDALFAMASVGVDGVNIHTYHGSSYELFSFTRARGQWRARVYPEYHGLELFAQAAPPGSQLINLYGPATKQLRTWATRAPDGRLRITLINDDLRHARTVAIKASRTNNTATLTSLTQNGPLSSKTVATTDGYYVIRVPQASAALLTR